MGQGIRGSSSVSGFIFPLGSADMTVVTVELFISNFCENCIKVKSMVDHEVMKLGKTRFDVRCVDVIEQIDYAVALGVLATPAIAIDGELVCTGLPKADCLRAALARHAVVGH